MNKEWKQPDVHQWSETMRAQLTTEFPFLSAETAKREVHFNDVCKEILEKYKGDRMVSSVLDKIRGRIGLKDKHLCDILPAGLLAIVWTDQITLVDEPESYEHFRQTLEDIGGTCLQGDTHRLFSTYVALSRDIQQSIVD